MARICQGKPDESGVGVKERLSRYAVVASAVLLALKLWAWRASGSLAILSDALNSSLDILSYGALALCIRIQDKGPDAGHPYGHRRAEPLASMLIAVFAVVLGFNLITGGVIGLFSPPDLAPVGVVLWAMGIAIAIKAVMVAAYRVTWHQTQSLAIQASLVDSRNDILATAVALLGFTVGGAWDALAAVGIGLWIAYSGVSIGIENLGYLMGRSPSAEVLRRLHDTALSVPGVRDTNDLLAHYVGDLLHVELHAEVDPALSIGEGHRIESELQRRLEEVPEVGKAFVHLDPVETAR